MAAPGGAAAATAVVTGPCPTARPFSNIQLCNNFDIHTCKVESERPECASQCQRHVAVLGGKEHLASRVFPLSQIPFIKT